MHYQTISSCCATVNKLHQMQIYLNNNSDDRGCLIYPVFELKGLICAILYSVALIYCSNCISNSQTWCRPHLAFSPSPVSRHGAGVHGNLPLLSIDVSSWTFMLLHH